MEYNSDFRYDLEFGKKDGESWFKSLVESEEGTVEVKSDRMTKETGNIYIEYESRGKPSGIRTTQATYWVYKTEEEFGFIISTKRLKEKLIQLLKEGRIKKDVKGGDNNTSLGFLVRAKDLV